MSEISLLISLLLLALFGVTMASGENIEAGLRIPSPIAIAALLNIILATLGLYFGKDAKSIPWSAAVYGLMAIWVGALIYVSGGAFSPYIALWMLVAVFAGLFGLGGILLLGLVANSYIVWQLIEPSGGLTNARLLLFALAADLPLLVSYIIWHKKTSSEKHKDGEVSALAKQLSTEATKSEIVINSIADGVVAVDATGIIQLINPAAENLTGWAGSDAGGLHYESVLKLVNKQDAIPEAGQNPFEEVKQTKQPVVNNDLTLVSKSGKKMLVSLVVSPVLEGPEVAAVIAVFRDITAEKAREREQAEFVSTASHEMRTPVAAIEGYLALVANPLTANIDDTARTYLAKAQESVHHLGRLFQDLLTVSRAEDGRLKSHPEITDVVTFVADITESLAPKAVDKNIALHYAPYTTKQAGDSAHRVAPIYYANADHDHLREVTANLIENAIKYTKEGTVTVDVSGDETRIVVSIRDSGIGIPHEDIPHLFQKFYRVDNSDTREIGGTGLGLYICKRLVESMSGRMWVESEFGRGSAFFVALPRVSSMELESIEQSKTINALQREHAETLSPAPLQNKSPAPQIPAMPQSQSVPQPTQQPAFVPTNVISDIQAPASSYRGSLAIPGRQNPHA